MANMLLEIERKFLVKGDFKSTASSNGRICQGYLNSDPARTVRVRIQGDSGFITIKGIGSESGMSRFEWEKSITAEEACSLLLLCETGVIDKTRYYFELGSHVFEVDEFHGENEGLVVAEVELASEDEVFQIPEWLGDEVTGLDHYYNAALSKKPYSQW
jgi:adenylate cyclase